MKIIINPDEEYVREVRAAIKQNGGYCCCKLVKNKEGRGMYEKTI